MKDETPDQRLFLSKLPGQRIGPSFPRTEEARGSNPLTSTYEGPVMSGRRISVELVHRVKTELEDTHSAGAASAASSVSE